MHIDENTPGSVANEEAVRVLKGWLLALYMVDCLVCVIGALGKSFSISYGFWLLLKSLFFSYFTGILLLFVAVRCFGRVIGITKVTPVGILKYCVLLACISVVMGGVLVYQASPTPPTMHLGRSDLKYRDARQVDKSWQIKLRNLMNVCASMRNVVALTGVPPSGAKWSASSQWGYGRFTRRDCGYCPGLWHFDSYYRVIFVWKLYL